MSKIKASRNGENREFELEFWKNMPDDKYGWKAAAEIPEEVKELVETKVTLSDGKEVVVKTEEVVTNSTAAAEIPEEVKGEANEEVKTSKPNKSAKAEK